MYIIPKIATPDNIKTMENEAGDLYKICKNILIDVEK